MEKIPPGGTTRAENPISENKTALIPNDMDLSKHLSIHFSPIQAVRKACVSLISMAMTPYLGGGCSCTSDWWQLQLLTHNIEVTEIDKLMARNTRTQTWNWNEGSWWINRTRQQLKWHQAGWEAKLLAAWWSNWWCIWLLMFNCMKNNFSCSGGKEAVVKDERFERRSQTGNAPKLNPNKNPELLPELEESCHSGYSHCGCSLWVTCSKAAA